MVFISVTRLRLRSILFFPAFFWYSNRSIHQAKECSGNLDVKVRKTQGLTFWTLTVWENAEAMMTYRNSGTHHKVMPKLVHWCDEASTSHWQQPEQTTPSWEVAAQHLVQNGRLLKVKYPSVTQQAKQISVS